MTAVRARNPRGQGERLREDLVAAAVQMVEAGELEQLTLRGIARRVGIAATSVYLHFPDVDQLLAVVVERAFRDLTSTVATAVRGVTDPAEELRARCRAYCHFGLGHPFLYRLMFEVEIPAPLLSDPAATPGRLAFENLVQAVARCQEAGLVARGEEPFRLASLVWVAEHGLVLARIARPQFPWSPTDEMVDEMVNRLLSLY